MTVHGSATTQKIQKYEERLALFDPSLETSKLKKAVPNKVAINELGKNTSVMIAIVFMEALSRCITLLSC